MLRLELCLKLRQALVEWDSADSGSRDGLSAIHEKVGDVLKAQGKLDAAVEEYQKSFYRRRTLADQDKFNAGGQHDLIVLLCKLASAKSLTEGSENVLKAKTLLQEATNIAAEYNGADRETLINSIKQSSQGLGQ